MHELRLSPILRSWTYALRASANSGIELAPIGSDYECETGKDPPSSRETSTLPDKGGSPCHAPSIPHQAHLATVFGLASAKGDEPSALLPPPRHPDSVISRNWFRRWSAAAAEHIAQRLGIPFDADRFRAELGSTETVAHRIGADGMLLGPHRETSYGTLATSGFFPTIRQPCVAHFTSRAGTYRLANSSTRGCYTVGGKP